MRFALLQEDGFYGWVALTAAAMVYFVLGAVTISAGLFLPELVREFGWRMGPTSGAFALTMGISYLIGPMAGRFIVKFGPRKAMVLGNIACTCGLLIAGFSWLLWHFYAAFGVLIGLGSGIGGILAGSTVVSNWFQRKVPLAMALLMSIGGLGGVIMIPLMTSMIRTIGWRSTYIVLSGIVFFFGVVVVAVLVRDRPEDLGQIPDGSVSSTADNEEPTTAQYITSTNFTLKEAKGKAALWIMVVLTGVIFFLVAMITTHQVKYLTGIGITQANADRTIALFSLVNTIGMLLTGGLSLKVDVKILTTMGSVLVFVSMGLGLATASMLSACIYTVLFALGTAAVMVGVQSLYPVYFGRMHYARIVGFTMPFSVIGGVAGTTIPGFIFDATKGYVIAFVVACAVAFLGLLCALFLTPPHKALQLL